MSRHSYVAVAISILFSTLPLFASATSSVNPDRADDYGTSITSTTDFYCPNLTSTFQRRATDTTTGGQVSELQKFLGDYYNLDDSAIISGFFGRTTQRYLIQFQTEQGLPAFGIAGSLTRAKIASVCGGTTPPPNPSSSFSATPTSGNAPLNVGFTATNINTSHSIDFGDGQQGKFSVPECAAPLPGTVNPNCTIWHASHTYASAGTYIAKLSHVPSTNEANCAGVDCWVLGKVTITVGGMTPLICPAGFISDGTQCRRAPISDPICPAVSLQTCPIGYHYVFGPTTYDTNFCPIRSAQCVMDATTTNTFTATPQSGLAPLIVAFNGNVNCPLQLGAVSVDFGDGSALGAACNLGSGSSNFPLSHTYASGGTYIAKLTAQGDAIPPNGVRSSSLLGSATVTVLNRPILCPQGSHSDGTRCVPDVTTLFSASPTSGNVPLTVSFSTTQGGLGYTVFFGDGKWYTFTAMDTPECPAPRLGTTDPQCSTWRTYHTYTSSSTYTAQLQTPRLSICAKELPPPPGTDCGLKIVGTTTIMVSGSTPSPSISVSASPSRTAVAVGSVMNITWGAQNAPKGSSVYLYLADSTGHVESNALASNQTVSGTYAWTIPSTVCLGDVCGIAITRTDTYKTYQILAKLVPSNYCSTSGQLMVCTNNTTQILASAGSDTFIVSASQSQTASVSNADIANMLSALQAQLQALLKLIK